MASESARPQAGFALLFIFLMAAVVAILLFSATPRAAFEAQRDQEQLLIDRGEQYKRAIQVFYRTTHRYPAKLEELENTGNQRFLRRRYVDPFTGSAEWRLIHVGPGGVLTDSLTVKKKGPIQGGSVNNFITELQPLGTTDTSAAGANVALRRRSSEMAGAPSSAGAPAADQPAPDPNAMPPGAQPDANSGGAIVGIPPGAVLPPSGSAGAPDPNAPPPVNNGYPNPTGAYAGNQGQPGSPVSPASVAGGPGIPGAPGAPGGNAAASLIQNLLTRPRPGGFPGPASGPQAAPNGALNDGTPPVGGPTSAPNPGAPGGLGTPITGTGNPAIGGGIAGVASKDEHSGIKIYNDKSKHNEWEFIYDFGKEAAAAANLNQRPNPGPAKP